MDPDRLLLPVVFAFFLTPLRVLRSAMETGTRTSVKVVCCIIADCLYCCNVVGLVINITVKSHGPPGDCSTLWIPVQMITRLTLDWQLLSPAHESHCEISHEDYECCSVAQMDSGKVLELSPFCTFPLLWVDREQLLLELFLVKLLWRHCWWRCDDWWRIARHG